MKDVPSRRRHICLFCCHAELLHVACHIVTACGIFIHFNLNNLKILTANGKRLTTNCSLRFEVNANLKVSNVCYLPSKWERSITFVIKY